MHQSKLVKLFLSLDKKEKRLLKKWVNSPIHNQHKDVIQLFDFLFTRYSYNSKTLDKKRAWKYIYPNKKFDDLRIRHVMSFSLKTLEDFVRYNQSKNNKFSQQKKLTEVFRDKKLIKYAHRTLQKAENGLRKQSPKDETYHFNQYQLEALKFDIEGTQNRTRATNISDITHQASLFFMITTLRYAYMALSQQSIKKTDYKIPLLESVLVQVRENDYNNHPILMIYYHGYQTLNTPEDASHYDQLNHYLDQSSEELGEKEQRAVLLMSLNYAIKQMNKGNKCYVQEALRLYKKGLAENLLIENNKMSHFAYKNIVSLGIIQKEYDWLDYFIHTYAEKLDKKHRENYRDYSFARLVFARGDFDKAMQLLIQADYDDILLNIGAKVMLLKLYYQQEYWEALEALTESFRIFLNRKKELSYHKTHYTNLISLVKKLMNLAEYNKSELAKIEEQAKNTHPLAEKEWLLAQVEQKKRPK